MQKSRRTLSDANLVSHPTFSKSAALWKSFPASALMDLWIWVSGALSLRVQESRSPGVKHSPHCAPYIPYMRLHLCPEARHATGGDLGMHDNTPLHRVQMTVHSRSLQSLSVVWRRREVCCRSGPECRQWHGVVSLRWPATSALHAETGGALETATAWLDTSLTSLCTHQSYLAWQLAFALSSLARSAGPRSAWQVVRSSRLQELRAPGALVPGVQESRSPGVQESRTACLCHGQFYSTA